MCGGLGATQMIDWDYGIEPLKLQNAIWFLSFVCDILLKLMSNLEYIESQISDSLKDTRIKKGNKVIEDIKVDSGKFYKYAKSFAKTKDDIGPLQNEKGEIVNDPKVMAEILSQQYCSVFSKPKNEY